LTILQTAKQEVLRLNPSRANIISIYTSSLDVQ